MATATEQMQVDTLLPARLRAALELTVAWRTWRRQRAEARRTYAELSRLSDRELADIGLHRASIGDVARELAGH